MIRALLFVLLLAFGAVADAATIAGRVVGVADGDTLTILDADLQRHVIRLDGIDAPEKGQAFGQASKRHLSDLAFDREAVAECHKVDRYGRRVCSVVVAGVDVCLDQLRVGLAWVFTRYAHELPVSRRAAYVDAETAARGERSGLWGDATATAPWEWRRTRGATAQGAAVGE